MSLRLVCREVWGGNLIHRLAGRDSGASSGCRGFAGASNHGRATEGRGGDGAQSTPYLDLLNALNASITLALEAWRSMIGSG